MAKTKILPKQKKSSKNTATLSLKKNTGVREYDPTKELLDETFIGRAIWECLKNNDPEGVIDIVQTHLAVVERVTQTKKAQRSRISSVHELSKKNQTIKALAEFVHESI